MGKGDIEYLKIRLRYHILHEEYEKAEKIKKWIIELGGDPTIIKVNESVKKK